MAYLPQYNRGSEILVKILTPQDRLKLQQSGVIKGTEGIENIGGSEYYKVPNPAALQTLQSKGFIQSGAARTPLGSIPEDFQKIPGAQYTTKEAQRGAFSDIRPVGQAGTPGSFLIGKPKTDIAKPISIETVDPNSGTKGKPSGVTGKGTVANTLPPDTSGQKSIADTISPLTASFEQLKTQIADLQKQRIDAEAARVKDIESQQKAAAKKGEEYVGKLETEEATRKSPQDIYDEALAQYGLTKETFAKQQALNTELAAYQTQLADLDTKEAQAMEQSANRLAPMTFIRGEQAQVQRNYAIQKAGVGAKAGVAGAQIQAISGNIVQAQQMASKAVELAVYEQKQKVDDLRYFIDLNRDIYDTLEKEKKEIIDGILAENVAELDRRTTEKQAIMQLMLDTPSAEWSGLDFNSLTLEQAVSIATKEKGKLAGEERLQTQIIEVGGTKILINSLTGETIQELGAADPDIYDVKEEDAAGNITVVGLDKRTGQEVYRKELGKIGKGTAETKPPKSFQEWELAGGKQSTGMDFGEWLNRNKAGGELSDAQQKTINIISDNLRQEPLYQIMTHVQNDIINVKSGVEEKNGFGDLMAINAFQRINDPGVSVRQEEFKTVKESQAWLQKMLNVQGKVISGNQLTEDSRQKLLTASLNLYNNKARNYNDIVGKKYEDMARKSNIPSDLLQLNFAFEDSTNKIDWSNALDINSLTGMSWEDL